jgi:DNA ligase-associated metallophosphoesterase
LAFTTPRAQYHCSTAAQAIISSRFSLLPVIAPLPNRVVSIDRNILLDGRLALFHKRERWLAVADLHFGFELSQRASGNLFPLWGMKDIEGRLLQLLADYRPRRLILLGDLVHDGTTADEFFALVNRLERATEVVLIMGNHDRHFKHRRTDLQHRLIESWQSNRFYFHHGDCAADVRDRIQIIGHHHPTGAMRDGAGLRLKLPAFVQRNDCWIMPAFSPWAAGTNWVDPDGECKIWLCSPQRVFELNQLSTH